MIDLSVIEVMPPSRPLCLCSPLQAGHYGHCFAYNGHYDNYNNPVFSDPVLPPGPCYFGASSLPTELLPSSLVGTLCCVLLNLCGSHNFMVFCP